MSGPIGVRLREIVRLPQNRFGKRLRSVVEAIESVHGVPRMEPIPVIETKSRTDNGAYKRVRGSGEPVAIEISKRGSNIELTFAHELGHFLESAAIPGSTFGDRQWVFDDFTKKWQDVVRESPSVVTLQEMLDADAPMDEEFGVGRRYAEYLLRLEELWARSYAQYVATVSGNGVMLSQIQARRSPELLHRLQWDDGEFGPIASEFESLFKEIGWRS